MLRESKMPTGEEILLACARGCYRKIFSASFFRNISFALASGDNLPRMNHVHWWRNLFAQAVCCFSTSFTKGNMVRCIFIFL